MEISFLTYLGAVLTAAVLTFAATPLVKKLAVKIGAIDIPKDNRRMHHVPIPLLGGLAIFIGFVVSILIFVETDTQVEGMLLGAVIIVALGIVDDMDSVGAIPKLFVQIAAASIAVLHGTVVEYISNPFSSGSYIDLGVMSVPLTILWIVAITNAVNLIDGLDGLAAGVSAISSVSLVVIAFIVSEPSVALIMIALVGTCLGFLPFNVYPAKIFMGDTGSTFLGFILGCMSIQGLFKMYAVISFAIPFIIIGLPIFDTGFAFLRRIFKGKNPLIADRGHVHHKLIDMGFSQKQSVALLYMVTCALGLFAMLLTTKSPVRWIFALAVLVLVFVVVSMISKKHHDSAANHCSASGIQNGKSPELPEEPAPGAGDNALPANDEQSRETD